MNRAMHQNQSHSRTPIFDFPLPMITRALASPFSARWEHAYASSGQTIRSAASATAGYFQIRPWEIFVRLDTQARQKTSVSTPRMVAMAVVASRSNMSKAEIGRRFGGFGCATVLHAIKHADLNAVFAVCALLDEVRG